MAITGLHSTGLYTSTCLNTLNPKPQKCYSTSGKLLTRDPKPLSLKASDPRLRITGG